MKITAICRRYRLWEDIGVKRLKVEASSLVEIIVEQHSRIYKP